MPVDSKHPDYEEYNDYWGICYDLFKGEAAIKAAGTKYLPMLSGQSTDAYSSYKKRGKFFNAFGRSVAGLSGLVMRKDPIIEIPDGMIEITESITPTGESLNQLVNNIVHEETKFGRCGLLADKMDEKTDPYLVLYKAPDIINWRTTFVDGKEKLTLLVLREVDYDYDSDEYDPDEVDQLRVFKIDDDGYAICEVYIKKKNDRNYSLKDDTKQLFIRKKKIDYIPFVFINSDSLNSDLSKPPLLDLAFVNISHWRKSVDMEYGLHLTALPTPYAVGFEVQGSIPLGPGKGLISDEIGANCGFMEFTGAGLEQLREELDRDERQMAVLGARLIEKSRTQVETAETTRLRQSGEAATLSTISKMVSAGITQSLKYLYRWMNILEGKEDDINCTVNNDFIDNKITPQQITALSKTLQAGHISRDTFLYNLETGEVLPPERTIEEEKDLIEAEFRMQEFETNEIEDEEPEEDENNEEKTEE